MPPLAIESGDLVDGVTIVKGPGNVLTAPFQGVTNLRQGGNVPGISADGTTGADSHLAEYFYGDMRCNTTTIPVGFDAGAGQNGSAGKIFPATAGTQFWGTRQLVYGGGFDIQATQFCVTARLLLSAGNNSAAGSFVGMDSGPAKAQNTVAANAIGIGINAQGFYFTNQGTVTLLLPIGGASSGTAGYTDSGGNGSGWGAPTNNFYDVTLSYPGDGSVTISICQYGTANYSYSFYLQGQGLPSAGLKNLSYSGTSASDQIANISYAAMGASLSTAQYLVPHQPGRRNPIMCQRFPVCGNIFLWLSPSYVPGGNNPLVIDWHGFSANCQVIQGIYSPTSQSLLQHGYSILAIQGTVNDPWGNAQGVADVAAAFAKVQAAYSFAPQPILMSDSAGTFNTLNATMQGSVTPLALIAFCGNTSLAYDYNNGASGNIITPAYNISASNPYAVATLGYDPISAATPAYQAANPQWLRNLTAVPMLFFSSPNDTVVTKSQNTDPFAAMINANGGYAQVVTTSGDHEDGSNFNQPQTILAFLAGTARKGVSTYSPFTATPLTGNLTIAAGQIRQNYQNSTASSFAVTPVAGAGAFQISNLSTGLTTLALSPENLISHSNDFENAYWANGSTYIIATNVADPFGGTQARTIKSTGANTGQINTTTAMSSSVVQNYTFSVWVQGVGSSIGYNMTIGNFVNNNVQASKVVTLTAQWQKVSLSVTSGPGGLLWIDMNDNSGAYVPSGGVANIYGAQLTTGHQKAFVATTGTAVVGAYDVIGATTANPVLFVTEVSNGVFQTSTTYP